MFEGVRAVRPSGIRSVVFLFDADADGVPRWYGGVFDPAFLHALSVADALGETKTAVLRGDILLSTLAQKVSDVSSDGRGTSHTISHDMNVYKTVIWDLVDAIASQWTTLDLESFSSVLGRHSIHCLCAPTLSLQLAEAIDGTLTATNGYLGALEIDMGNPVQRRLFIDCLIKDAAIVDGQVLLETSFDGEQYSLFEGAAIFKPNGLRWVDYGGLEEVRLTIPSADLSPRGRTSLARLEGKRQFTVKERVLAALVRSRDVSGDQRYRFSAGPRSLDPLEAKLPEEKFVKYLLDPEHPKGGSKARFFRDVLAIHAEDWRYLAAQLHEGLRSSEIEQASIKSWGTAFGISFNAKVKVRGLNGREAVLKTNWIMEPGQVPRLSSAYPADDEDSEVMEARNHLVVPNSIQGELRWQRVFEIASAEGVAASERAVPTPMKIVGFPVEMEGLCGYAWIRVPDARRGFARWLIKNGHARKHHGGGARISADTGSQSSDRAIAYARAFAAVLKQNGIECKVESRLD